MTDDQLASLQKGLMVGGTAAAPFTAGLSEIPGAVLGLYQILHSSSQLKKLHQQKVPEHGETPEMRASRMRAEQLAQGGFTPAEKTAFRNNVAQDINTQTQRSLDIGGGQLGRVIAGQGKINEMKGESDFATRDAALHRQNIQYADKFSQALQNIHNMNIDQQLKQRLMAEQALGGAIKTGTENLTNAASGALAFGFGNGGGAGSYTNGSPTYKNTGAQRGFTDNTLGGGGVNLSTKLGYQNPSEARYNPPQLGMYSEGLPRQQYSIPNIMPNVGNAVSTNFDQGAYDPMGFFRNLGNMYNAPRIGG